MESMEERFRKGYAPLFKRNDDLLQNLFGEVEKSSHKTLILWSFLLIKEPVAYLKVLISPGNGHRATQHAVMRKE